MRGTVFLLDPNSKLVAPTITVWMDCGVLDFYARVAKRRSLVVLRVPTKEVRPGLVLVKVRSNSKLSLGAIKTAERVPLSRLSPLTIRAAQSLAFRDF